MVQLPALKADQLRRPVYFFRTHEQMEKKLQGYAEKADLLGASREALALGVIVMMCCVYLRRMNPCTACLSVFSPAYQPQQTKRASC